MRQSDEEFGSLPRLFELTKALLAADSAPTLSALALEHLHRLLGVEHAVLMQRQPDGVLRVRGWRSVSENVRSAMAASNLWVANERDPEPSFFADIEIEPRLAPLRAELLAEGIHAAAVLPLTCRCNPVGIAVALYERPHTFQSDERILFNIVAAQLAFAIERVQSEAELTASGKRLQTFFETVAEGIAVFDQEGRYRFANREGARMIGVDSVDELLRTPSREILQRFELFDEYGNPVPPEQLPASVALRHGQRSEMLVRARRKNGEADRWSLITAAPVLDANGLPEMAVSAFRDVTRERELYESEHRARAAAERLARRFELLQRDTARLAQSQSRREVDDILVAGVEDGTEATWVNLYRLIGDRLMPLQNDAMQPSSGAVSVGSDHPAAQALDAGVALFFADGADDSTGVAQSYVAFPLGSTHGYFGVLLAGFDSPHALPDEERDFLQALCNQAALAFERIEAQERVDLARNRSTFLVRAGELLGGSLDYEQTLPTVARLAVPEVADWCVVELMEVEDGSASLAISHVDPRKVQLARELRERYPPDPDAPRGVTQVFRSGEPLLYEEISDEMLAAGARNEEHLRLMRELELRSAMIVPMNARGRTIGVITFVSSRSDVRFGDADLDMAMSLAQRAALAVDNARLYLRAQRAVQARESLLAVVSHDLRNPLGVVRMVAGAMSSRPPDGSVPDMHRQAEILDRNAGQMERLIRDLLDFSRLESGSLSVSFENHAFDEIIEHAIETARYAGEERGIRIERSGSPLNIGMRCDRERLLQVLGNLLRNAIEHSAENGHVEVTAARDGERIHVTVRDSGAGIDETEMAHLFEPYWQALNGGRKRQGLGLGLYIAKGLVRAHGGEIWAESEFGRGSAFHITLPSELAEPAGDVCSREVLIVDDDQHFSREVADVLRAHGYAVSVSSDGADALARLQQQAPPGLIFLDLMMPGVDGWEMLTFLRADPVLASVPTVIMSSVEGEASVLRNAAGYLQKPVSVAQLLQAVGRYCGPSRRADVTQEE